jgi:hypothetical protein
MPNMRLVEVAKVIGEWMRMQEDDETNMAKRITGKRIFELVGSVT